jgi:hypothetical protein
MLSRQNYYLFLLKLCININNRRNCLCEKSFFVVKMGQIVEIMIKKQLSLFILGFDLIDLCEHYRKKRILKIDPRQDRFWVEGLSAAF